MEVVREYSFCNHALNYPNEIMEVVDSTKDSRFRDNPFVVGAPGIRYYAGSPLITPTGYALGTLCVIDIRPRRLSAEKKRGLKLLADRVIQHFEMKRNNLELQKRLGISLIELDDLKKRVSGLRDDTAIGEWYWDRRTNEFRLSETLKYLVGLKLTEQMIPASDRMILLRAIATKGYSQTIKVNHRLKGLDGQQFWVESQITSQVGENGKVESVKGVVADISQFKKYVELLEEVLFSISHSVRRPVTSLQGLVDLFTNYEEMNEATMREYMSRIKSVADEMDEYTKSLTKIFLTRMDEAEISRLRK